MTNPKNVEPKPTNVDLSDAKSVEYWCRRWSVTEAELRKAVENAGPDAPAVAFALGREAY